jgi:hypothetical protein
MNKPMNALKISMLILASVVFYAISYAQEKSVDVNINKDSGGGFFASPWVWVVGGAIFILLLVALLRGRKD